MNVQEMKEMVRVNDRICYICALMMVETLSFRSGLDEIGEPPSESAMLYNYVQGKQREFDTIVIEEAVKVMAKQATAPIAESQLNANK